MHPSPPCRLAHLQLLPLLSGVQRVSLDELRSLDRASYLPHLICKEPGPLSEQATAAGTACHFVPDLVRPISPRADLRALRQLVRLLRGLRPQVLHTHSSKTGMLGRVAGRLSRVPVVVHTVHGFAFPFAESRLTRAIYHALEYIGGHLCDALVVLNEADRQFAVEKLHVRPQKVHLMPNGIDLSQFQALSAAQRQAVRCELFPDGGDEPVCIGMVGRLWRQKNPECLVRAAVELQLRGCRDFRVVLIGDGDLRPDLEALIDRHAVGGAVRLLGWRDDVPRLLGALDIFVLPSRWEGLPLAIIEAMAAGLPVVASDIPGNRDLVDEGVDGHLFVDDDAIGLADRLQALIADRQRARAMGAAGRAKALREYSLERRTERVDALYRQLLTTSAAQARLRRQQDPHDAPVDHSTGP